MSITPRAAIAALLALSCDARPLLNEAELADMQKQRLTIPLSGGIATGTDGKQLPIGKSEEMQNVRPGRIGEVTQRNGTSALPTALLGTGGGTLPAPWALGTLRGALVSFSGVGDHPANAYSPTELGWATDVGNSGGARAAIKTQRRGPIAATRQQVSGNGLQPDSVDSNGYRFMIYQTTRNGVASVILTALDIATGGPLAETVHAGAFVSYGVRVVNGSAVFVYATTALITIESWSTTTPDSAALTTITAAKTVANAGRQFDMLVKDATTISAAYGDGTNVQCFDYVPLAGAATFWTPKDSAAANIPTTFPVAWMQDFAASGKIALIARSPGPGLRVFWDIPTAGATRQAVSTYIMDAGGGVGTMAGFTVSNAATGEFVVLYDDDTVATPTRTLLRAASRESGVIGTTVFYRSTLLNSKPFVGSDGKVYAAVEFFSSVQPTRYVVRVPSTRTNPSQQTGVVAKIQVNGGYVNAIRTGPLCGVSALPGGDYVFANTVQLRLPGNPTAYVPQGVGVDVVHVKFKELPDTTTSGPREAIDSLFTPGGTVGQFDGRSYVEAGFSYYPEQPIVTPTGAGRVNAAGTYYYVCTYAWLDMSGRTWESAPSVVNPAVTLANTSADVVVQTLRLADRDDVMVRFYRGAINDPNSLALIGAVVNDPTVDTVTFSDTFADTTVASGQALYTNGGVGNRPLANDGIPGFSSLAVTADRAWGVSNDNPYEVWMSNKFIPGQGWRFSEQNKLILNDSQGPVTAVAKQPSGVVIIFKANCYYLVSGDGPNQAGNGGSFSVSQPIIGAGTNNPRSILETPSGIEFRNSNATAGARAWYRVNTANATEYIGSPIERYTTDATFGTAAPIVGAVLIPSTGETRYYTSEADSNRVTTLVHDSISDTWMVDTSPDDFDAQTAACAYGDGAAVARRGQVWIDDLANPGKDEATQFTVYSVTPWIKGADLDGYAMFREARGVGECPGGLLTNVSMQADFDVTTNVLSESATTGALWDWAVKYPAKLSSFRFAVSYLAPALSANAPRLSAIVVEYGVKSGMAPSSYTKRMQ